MIVNEKTAFICSVCSGKDNNISFCTLKRMDRTDGYRNRLKSKSLAQLHSDLIRLRLKRSDDRYDIFFSYVFVGIAVSVTQLAEMGRDP